MINKSSTLKRNMAAIVIAAFLFGCAENPKHYADDPSTLVRIPTKQFEYNAELSYANNLMMAANAPFMSPVDTVPDLPMKTDDYQRAYRGKSDTFYISSTLFNSYAKMFGLTKSPASPGLEALDLLTKKQSLTRFNHYRFMKQVDSTRSYVDQSDETVRYLESVYLGLLKQFLGDAYHYETSERVRPRRLPRVIPRIVYWKKDQPDIKFTKSIYGGVGLMTAPEPLNFAEGEILIHAGSLPESNIFNYLRGKKLQENPENHLDFYRALSRTIPGMFIYLAPNKYYLDASLTDPGKVPLVMLNGETHFFVVEDKS